jgi:hypothetical protein
MAHYILKGRAVVPCENWMAWTLWFCGTDRAVARDDIVREDADTVTISTVFLGHDSRADSSSLPFVFESMVFGGPLNGQMQHYCTWDEAERGHRHLLAESITEGELAAWELHNLLARFHGTQP